MQRGCVGVRSMRAFMPSPRHAHACRPTHLVPAPIAALLAHHHRVLNRFERFQYQRGPMLLLLLLPPLRVRAVRAGAFKIRYFLRHRRELILPPAARWVRQAGRAPASNY
jgi:hypothetical protein